MPALALVLATVALGVAAVMPAAAWAQAGEERAGPQDPSGAELLSLMASSREATYQARKLIVYLGPPQSAAVVEVRSSPQGRFVRAETPVDVTRVWWNPSHGLTAGDAHAMRDTAPAPVHLDLRRIEQKYEVRADAPITVLGVQVVPVTLIRREDSRMVERMWIHPVSGVVYRRELYGQRGGLVGMSTMLDMQWGSAEREEPYHGPAPQTVRASRDVRAPRALAYGYRLISSYEMEVDGTPTEHWLYSDGLHTLSVFRRPGGMRAPDGAERVELAATAAYAGRGPGTWSWQGGGAAWTLVAEETQLDPVRLTGRLPQGGPSVLSRLGSWWSSAFRWIGDRF